MSKLINWKGLIFNGCEILNPVDENKIRGRDNWIIKCHCKRIFKTMPVSISSNHTKSCGCLADISSKINGKLHQKQEYYNYINPITKVMILKPYIESNDTSRDNWICLCPLHDPPVIFVTKPTNVVNGNTKSCGCIQAIKASNNITNELKRLRISKGFDENTLLTEEYILIRNMLFQPIRDLVLQIDNYECQKCHKVKNEIIVHHIHPIAEINYKNPDSFLLAFELTNLISLCVECHFIAHNLSWVLLDEQIQKELQNIVIERKINKFYKDEYENIKITKIQPWLIQYLKGKT